MNGNPINLVRGIFALVISTGIGFVVYVRYGPGIWGEEDAKRRWQPIVHAVILSEDVTVVRNGCCEAMRCADPEALKRYLAGLEAFRLTGNYDDCDEDALRFLLLLETPEGAVRSVSLGGRGLAVTHPGRSAEKESFYLAQPADQGYIASLLVPVPGE